MTIPDSATYKAGDSLTFTVDIAFENFVSLTLDGKELVKDTDYTVKSGSTIITINDSYLKR
ncbi:hypothetical protein FACS18949_16020 [Clostridia bacterium]|nr:hypothetical protein FACS18949_16020 [Clostridia bacterium]